MSNNLLMLIKLDTDTMVFTSLLVSIVGAVAAISAAYYANVAAFYAKKAATRRDLTQVEQNTKHVEHFSNRILSIDIPMPPQEKQEDSQAPAQQEPLQPQVEREASPVQQEASMAQAQAQQEPSQAQVERRASQAEREATQLQSQREAPLVQEKQETTNAQPISISVKGEALGEVPLELFLTLQDSSVRVSRVETLGKAGRTLGSSPCKATDNALVFKSILSSEKVRRWWDAGELTSDGGGRSILRVYLQVDESGREVHRDMPVSIVEGLRNVGITSLIVWTIEGNI
jgi:flagellar biosynthesis GTPase FlhF